uniref:Uncharacterized protein n=1 Tax=candidate division WWE3 bacterium TaxID=2053526 RepID=A0A831Z251_UNCKA
MKFLDPYRKTLGCILDSISVLALAFAVYGAFWGDIWLASTQWMLVSIWVLIAAHRVGHLDTHF